MDKVEKSKSIKSFKWPFYVVKRMDLPKWKYWLIRVGGILLAFLAAGIMCTILRPGTFGTFFSEMFTGCFSFKDNARVVIDLLIKFAVLLLIAITLTPAFKMKFWNIGAEGQILVGCMAAAGFAKFAPSSLPNIIILLIAMVVAQVSGIIWATIPALLKVYFKANETLTTLMFNYIAALLGALMISIWIKNGSQTFGMLEQGTFPKILGNTGTLVIIAAVVIFVGMYFYIKKGKHGYELSVIGDSVETARYVGINVGHVTIRTMMMTGMLFGTIGFFLACGVHRSFNPTIVGGQGFTGVLIAWLGHFEPFEIMLFSFITAVLNQGTGMAASAVNMSSSQFSAICIGIFFFIIIACEFFARYQIKKHHKEVVEVKPNESGR